MLCWPHLIVIMVDLGEVRRWVSLAFTEIEQVSSVASRSNGVLSKTYFLTRASTVTKNWKFVRVCTICTSSYRKIVLNRTFVDALLAIYASSKFCKIGWCQMCTSSQYDKLSFFYNAQINWSANLAYFMYSLDENSAQYFHEGPYRFIPEGIPYTICFWKSTKLYCDYLFWILPLVGWSLCNAHESL